MQKLKRSKKSTHKVIEEKDATISLLNDGLKNREYENAGLQDEIKAKDP